MTHGNSTVMTWALDFIRQYEQDSQLKNSTQLI